MKFPFYGIFLARSASCLLVFEVAFETVLAAVVAQLDVGNEFLREFGGGGSVRHEAVPENAGQLEMAGLLIVLGIPGAEKMHVLKMAL